MIEEQYTVAADRPRSAVDEALGRMHKLATEAVMDMERLRENLIPVLRPSLPTGAVPMNGAVPPEREAHSPIYEQICVISQAFSDVIRVCADLRTRLDV